MEKTVTLVIGIMVLFRLGDSTPPPEVSKRTAQAAVTSHMSEVALCKAEKRLEEVIGIIRPGTCVHYATACEWSTHDWALHIIRQIGPAHLTVATWSISEPAVRHIVRALGDGRILSLSLLADWRVPPRCPEALQLARANSARCRLANIHAKVIVLHNAAAEICIVGSANLTNNPRIEAGIIAHDPAAARFHRDWIMAELANASPFDLSARGRPGGHDDE